MTKPKHVRATNAPRGRKRGLVPKSKEKAVVVCTVHRGVFFGYAEKTDGETIRLTKPRMCVYWDVATRGILGLAATGPTKGCRITNAPPAIEVRGITAVIECSPEAVAAWEVSPWGS